MIKFQQFSWSQFSSFLYVHICVWLEETGHTALVTFIFTFLAADLLGAQSCAECWAHEEGGKRHSPWPPEWAQLQRLSMYCMPGTILSSLHQWLFISWIMAFISSNSICIFLTVFLSLLKFPICSCILYFSIRSFNILSIVILKVLSDSPKTQVIFGYSSVDSFISWQWGVLFFLFLCLIIFKLNVRHAVYRNSRNWNEYYFICRSRIFFCQVISMRDWGNPGRSWAGFGFCCC